MDKYLLEILKESNTIIIPGLGALTITNSETGEIMFMPYLQHDDGKLAAFIAEKDGIEEVDAKNMVAKYVREIKSELDKGETYSMFRLGEFVKADDGDIEFTFWSDLNGNKEEEVITPVAASIEEPTVEEPLPEVVETPETPSEESEPVVETPEPEETVEEVPPVTLDLPVEPVEIELTEQEEEIKSTIEEALESTPEVEETIENNEPEIIPPVVETPEISNEPEIELTQEEEEIKQVISEALDVAPEPEETPPVEPVAPVVESYEATNYEDSYPKEPTFDSSTDPEVAAAGMTGEEVEDASEITEKKEKEKAGAGFWITLIIIALLIIAGGAYVGRNYHEIKQHIPFLADKKEESTSKKSLKEEMSEAINEDKEKYSGSSSDSPEEDDSNVEEDTENASEEGSEEETPVAEPEVVEQPVVVVEQPPVSTPSVSSSSSGPYKVIAGAFSSEANANRLAAEYKAKGLKSEVFLKGELHAVSMQSYATSEEANANLAKLQSMAPGAWIYYKR